MKILAIDPGNKTSSWVLLETAAGWPPRLEDFYLDEANLMLEARLRQHTIRWQAVAIEMVRSYGRPVGADIFETCVWIGRFEAAIDHAAISRVRLGRKEVLSTLGVKGRGAGDKEVRARLLEIYGPDAKGNKRAPGRLYGVTEDVWSALAVGVACAMGVERKRAG